MRNNAGGKGIDLRLFTNKKFFRNIDKLEETKLHIHITSTSLLSHATGRFFTENRVRLG
jgi:hypothetical protein